MKGKWLGLAALISAGIASLCCIGPVLFIALGLGSLGAFAVFEQYRPILLGVTALLLGIAFYFTYRKREITCEDGTCKLASGSPKAKVLLWIVALFALGFMSAPYWLATFVVGESPAANARFIPGSFQTVRLDLEGMTCSACAAHIEKTVSKVPGVLDAEVSYMDKEAVIKISPDAVITPQLIEAVRSAGFDAAPKQE